MNRTVALLAAFAALTLSGPAHAHGVTTPQHGGVVQMNGETLFELVGESDGVALYVIDDDEPVDAAAMTARLSITANGARSDVDLAPAGGNRFLARGLVLPKGANVGVQVTDKASQARFGATFEIK